MSLMLGMDSSFSRMSAPTHHTTPHGTITTTEGIRLRVSLPCCLCHAGVENGWTEWLTLRLQVTVACRESTEGDTERVDGSVSCARATWP